MKAKTVFYDVPVTLTFDLQILFGSSLNPSEGEGQMRKYSLRRNQDMTLMRTGRTQIQTDNPNQPNPVRSVFGAEAEKKNHKKET